MHSQCCSICATRFASVILLLQRYLASYDHVVGYLDLAEGVTGCPSESDMKVIVDFIGEIQSDIDKFEKMDEVTISTVPAYVVMLYKKTIVDPVDSLLLVDLKKAMRKSLDDRFLRRVFDIHSKTCMLLGLTLVSSASFNFASTKSSLYMVG